MVPGSRALAWCEAGHLARAADAPGPPNGDAGGWGSAGITSPSTICARCPASRWNAATSGPRSMLTERVLAISEQRQPLFEFLALLDLARIWAARGEVRDALATLERHAKAVAGASVSLLAWTD